MSKKHRNTSSLNEYDEFHEHNIFVSERTIYFGGKDFIDSNDEVTSGTIAEVIKNLHILEIRETAPIILLLNTVGGSWDDGIAVYDIIKSLSSPVTIIGLGKVYSMGSIILQAGDIRVLTKNTHLLIHDGTDGYIGETKNFERWAEYSKKIRKKMYEIYYEKMMLKNPKITLKDIERLCSNDTILSAEKSIELGLADEIITNNTIKISKSLENNV